MGELIINAMKYGYVERDNCVIFDWDILFDIDIDKRNKLYLTMRKYAHIEFTVFIAKIYDRTRTRTRTNIIQEPLILTKNVLTIIFHTMHSDIQILTSKNLSDIRFENHNAFYSFVLGKKLSVMCFNTHSHFNEPIELSKNLHVIQLGSQFNQLIRLPKYIRHISWASLGKFSQPIVLSKYLKYMRVPCTLRNQLIIERPLEHVVFDHVSLYEKSHVIEHLPDGTVFMTVEIDNPRVHSVNLPRTVRKVLK